MHEPSFAHTVDRDGEIGHDPALAANVRDTVRVPLTLLGSAGSQTQKEALIHEAQRSRGLSDAPLRRTLNDPSDVDDGR